MENWKEASELLADWGGSGRVLRLTCAIAALTADLEMVIGELHPDGFELHTKDGGARFEFHRNKKFSIFRLDNSITIDVLGETKARFTIRSS